MTRRTLGWAFVIEAAFGLVLAMAVLVPLSLGSFVNWVMGG